MVRGRACVIIVAASLACAACGARTGLLVEDPARDADVSVDGDAAAGDVARTDASIDAGDSATTTIDSSTDADSGRDATLDGPDDSARDVSDSADSADSADSTDSTDSVADVDADGMGDSDAGVEDGGGDACAVGCAVACVSGGCITVRSLSLGGSHTCAVMSDDSLRCWGANDFGQLGDGTTKSKPSPEPIAMGAGVSEAALDDGYTCATMTDGSARCWGWNGDGQLGDGTSIDRHTPIMVTGLGTSVRQLAVGGDHTCALMIDGSVRCWGDNLFGELGDGTYSDRLTPFPVVALGTNVKQISLGNNHSCALMNDGSVQCWGRNQVGQLGDGTTTDHILPAIVASLGVDVAQIALGGDHGCARMNDGTVRCWGYGAYGEIGDGVAMDRSTPVAITALGSEVDAIVLGGFHTCARMTDGSARCWGRNDSGQLGDGTTKDRWTPVPVTALGANVRHIALGEFHTCAVMNDGTASCWGADASGQLGNPGCYFGFCAPAW